MEDCIFCKIVNKIIPCQVVYEDEHVLGFKDIYPQAKIHHVFIHKTHTSTNVGEMSQEHPEQLAQLFQAMQKTAEKENFSQTGYRIVTNQGVDAGQTVFHTHFHLLGGERLGGFGSR